MTQQADGYSYQFNGRADTFDLIAIVSPEGETVATLHYWDEPDTDEAARAEASARLVCQHLNRWWFSGEWVPVEHVTATGEVPVPVPDPADARLDALTDEALGAFWRLVAGRFPQAMSGDLSPGATMALRMAAEDALREWVSNNAADGEPGPETELTGATLPPADFWRPDRDMYAVEPAVRDVANRLAYPVSESRANRWVIVREVYDDADPFELPSRTLIGEFEERESAERLSDLIARTRRSSIETTLLG